MRPTATILGLALLASGCGPTDEEIGRAVMLASPMAFAVCVGWTLLLAHLWRRVQPRAAISWRPILIGLGICVALAVLALTGVTEEREVDPLESTTSGIPGVLSLFGMALLVWGAGLLVLWLLAFRLWLHFDPSTAFGRSWMPALALMIWPCPLMAFAGTTDMQHYLVPIWVYLGFLGAVPGGLLLILLTEVLIRRAKAREPAEAA